MNGAGHKFGRKNSKLNKYRNEKVPCWALHTALPDWWHLRNPTWPGLSPPPPPGWRGRRCCHAGDSGENSTGTLKRPTRSKEGFVTPSGLPWFPPQGKVLPMTFPMLVVLLLSPWQHSPDHHLVSLATTHSQRKQLICCQLLSGVLSPAGSSGLRSRPEQAGTLPKSGSPLWAWHRVRPGMWTPSSLRMLSTAPKCHYHRRTEWTSGHGKLRRARGGGGHFLQRCLHGQCRRLRQTDAKWQTGFLEKCVTRVSCTSVHNLGLPTALHLA